MGRRLFLFVVLLSLAPCAWPVAQRAQTQDGLAPGAPGKDAQWPGAGKEAVGTSNTEASKVWFTLRGGVLDEVYYPTVDVANTQTLKFIVTSCGEDSPPGEESAAHRLEITDPRSLSFRQTS